MNKKKIIIFSVIGVIVLTVVGILIGVFVFSDEKRLKESAKQTVSEFLTAYRSNDPKAGDYLSSAAFGDDYINYNGIQGSVAERLTYIIINCVIDKNNGGSVIVDLEITNIDLASILQPFEQTNESDPDNLRREMSEKINAKDSPMRTYKCSVVVVNYPLGLKIVMTQDLSNALLGGYNEYLYSLIKLEGE